MQIVAWNSWNAVAKRHGAALIVQVFEAGRLGNVIRGGPVKRARLRHCFNFLFAPGRELQFVFEPQRHRLREEVRPVAAVGREPEIEDVFRAAQLRYGSLVQVFKEILTVMRDIDNCVT